MKKALILAGLAILALAVWMSMIINEKLSERQESRVVQAETPPSPDVRLYKLEKSRHLKEKRSYETSDEGETAGENRENTESYKEGSGDQSGGAAFQEVEGAMAERGEEEQGEPQRSVEEVKSEIRSVIFDRFVQGYNTKDIDRYISAFWKDGFLFQVVGDSESEFTLTDLDKVRENESRVFGSYQYLNYTVSDLNIEVDESMKRAKVICHTLLVGGGEERLSPYSVSSGEMRSEGISTFVMELRPYEGHEEWRIKEWYFEPLLRPE